MSSAHRGADAQASGDSALREASLVVFKLQTGTFNILGKGTGPEICTLAKVGHSAHQRHPKSCIQDRALQHVLSFPENVVGEHCCRAEAAFVQSWDFVRL